MIVPDSVGVLAALSICVEEALAQDGSGPVCWNGIVHGEPAWTCDSCNGSTCGMAYVSVETIYPYAIFGIEGADPGSCATMFAMRVQVGVVRCVPVADEDGNMPLPAEVTESALDLHADAFALRNAIVCCLESDMIRLGTWTPVGPQGGCAGGFWTVDIDLEA